jgi:hypothetical protein
MNHLAVTEHRRFLRRVDLRKHRRRGALPYAMGLRARDIDAHVLPFCVAVDSRSLVIARNAITSGREALAGSVTVERVSDASERARSASKFGSRFRVFVGIVRASASSASAASSRSYAEISFPTRERVAHHLTVCSARSVFLRPRNPFLDIGTADCFLRARC